MASFYLSQDENNKIPKAAISDKEKILFFITLYIFYCVIQRYEIILSNFIVKNRILIFWAFPLVGLFTPISPDEASGEDFRCHP